MGSIGSGPVNDPIGRAPGAPGYRQDTRRVRSGRSGDTHRPGIGVASVWAGGVAGGRAFPVRRDTRLAATGLRSPTPHGTRGAAGALDRVFGGALEA